MSEEVTRLRFKSQHTVSWVTGAGLLVIALLAGCAPEKGVDTLRDEEWFARESRSALFATETSVRTQQYLYREGYSRQFERDRIGVAKRLHARLIESGEREVAFYLAEICYLEARVAKGQYLRELFYAVSALRYAYAYLFDPKLQPAANEFDYLHRWSCDIYNRSLGRLIDLTQNQASEGAYRGPSTVAALSGSCTLLFQTLRLAWDLTNLKSLETAYGYEVRGFGAATKVCGVGTPFVGIRTPPAPEEKRDIERFLGDVELAFPITIFLRFEDSIRDTTFESPERAQLEVYDPFLVSRIEVEGRTIPLETDFTTPLAYALGLRPEVGTLSAMLRPEEYLDRAGLYMLQPYDEAKIPLVFVHGLMSSDLTWVPLLNDLIGDEEIRRRYQIWYFYYPTGNPILLSGSLLRQALLDVRAAYDPDGTNAVFDQMLVCGHSMGGLLTRLQLFSANDEWVTELLEGLTLDELELPPEQEEVLRRALHFERLSFVKRVIFMAVPHRGSSMAEGWVGRLGQRLISFTGRLGRLQRNLADRAKNLGREGPAAKFRKAVTGVGNLEPGSDFIKLLAEHPPPEDLPFHSIIGNNREADIPGGTDGIVPYESSHLDGAVSEKVVESSHSVHQTPEAVVEVRRILRLHLREIDQQRRGTP